MWAHQLLVQAGRALCLLKHRNSAIEARLQLQLGEQDIQALQVACARGGMRLGAYYHWYLQKLVVANRLRQLDGPSVQRMIASMDATDYSRFDEVCETPGGLLVAVPHHGHYILSIIALAERLRGKREVFVFYGDPATHVGNDLFDQLHGHVWGNSPWVHVIHDNRAGLVRALKALQQGAVVVIMPDVYKDEHDTLVIPFCGRQLNVLLGTAALARKTGAAILPLVSRARSGLRFAGAFGTPLLPSASAAPACPAEATLHADYQTTLSLFRQFETLMDPCMIHWQYVRNHYARQAAFPDIPRDELGQVTELFFSDPRINVDPTNAIHLQ
ncbi:MAG: hypothetical protein R3278_05240 [Lysobacter spongiicola]|nr:hypothetical protein [Lysobacter spongiicola]